MGKTIMPVVKKVIKNLLVKVHRKLLPKKTVLGRAACVGIDVFKRKNKYKNNVVLVNQQKARVDLLLSWMQGEARPRADIVEKHLLRKDVFPLIVEQERLPWFNAAEKIEYLLMDSFSELTDQKFVHKSGGWAFACHYSDINHTPEFETEFECRGLLDLATLDQLYDRFFDWFEIRFPNSKVIFIHYSAKFDKREQFKDRANCIRDVVNNIGTRRPYIANLHLNDDFFLANDKDDFPYHYSQDTYKKFVELWRKREIILC
jgi:hypothetical protein